MFAATVVFGQKPADERVFHTVHANTKQDVQEIAVAMRTIGNIRNISVDDSQKSISVTNASPAAVALAEWLFADLDEPAFRPGNAPDSQKSIVHEYKPAGGDEVVRAFHLAHAETIQELQEIAVLVRTIADIRTVFTYNAARTVVARGSVDQMALAGWLVDELDNSPNRPTPPAEFRMTDAGPENIVRVYHLTHADTVQKFQQIATYVRKTAEIRRVFTYNGRYAMALRATEDQLALADRLIKERDQ
jgi:hypothetical protein